VVKAKCEKTCFVKGKIWNPGDIRFFNSKADVENCFKYVEDVKEDPSDDSDAKPFSQWTKDQYLEKAKEKKIEIPEDVKTRDQIRDFLKDKIDQ